MILWLYWKQGKRYDHSSIMDVEIVGYVLNGQWNKVFNTGINIMEQFRHSYQGEDSWENEKETVYDVCI